MSLSPIAARAMQLLKAGLIGCHVVGLTAIGIMAVARGTSGLVSALLGVATVVLFFAVGHGVQVILVDRNPEALLWGSVLSYATRVSLLGAALAAYTNNRDRLAGLDTIALFVGIAAGVFGWVAAEIAAFTRMRIPAYDTPYVPPKSARGEDSGEDC
ncbi:MAG TPA: hypothetical protein PKM36_05895 [Propionibacteriaceae bacterium]|nr:hypothetical protein [Propionibacteriaceae bacterium]HQE30758.1 hypothetical protein [Propionibacteriaceae bacterium]